jgi:sulfur transfer complex TusBCD TusB component (DsrH family)
MSDAGNPNTTCLHLVASAGGRALRDCLAQSQAGDAIVFLDAGVLHLLTAPTSSGEGGGPTFLFAAADLEAHGLSACARAMGAGLAEDADVCALLAEHGHCLTWT